MCIVDNKIIRQVATSIGGDDGIVFSWQAKALKETIEMMLEKEVEKTRLKAKASALKELGQSLVTLTTVDMAEPEYHAIKDELMDLINTVKDL